MTGRNIEIQIPEDILAELEYMVELHQVHGAPNPQATVEDLIADILTSVADGSRRPGSWERGLLERMGLVSHSNLHGIYRQEYGTPKSHDTHQDSSSGQH